MRKLTYLILVALLLMSPPVLAADYQKGYEAISRGDFATALVEFQPLAEQGHVDAQKMLGQMYEFGMEVPQNFDHAYEWYTKAAEQGNAFAQHRVGQMYEFGRVVKKDYVQAAKWYTKAAEQSFEFAQYRLGEMFEKGRGVVQDNKLAYVWSSLAVINGNKYAVDNKDRLAKKLSPKEISVAQEMATKKYAEIEARKKHSN